MSGDLTGIPHATTNKTVVKHNRPQAYYDVFGKDVTSLGDSVEISNSNMKQINIEQVTYVGRIQKICRENLHNALHLSEVIIILIVYFIKTLNKLHYEINSIVEFISQLNLGHHRKPGGNERLFRSSIGLLRNEHPRSHLAQFKPRTYWSRARTLNV
ncbi:unnamed protein product [Schistosoma curassoni]|uniref:Uncharacterized protein n=1 Tax=Schistosoma curassoni TaxID=6186 RepID=A0A183KMR8_9TREM|nr:unnamed protein product [Schistosoma curassoni]